MTLSFTPDPNTVYSQVTFDFWRPLDSAPILANGPGAPLSEHGGAGVLPFANATVSDAQLDGTFAHDFSGTTLTVQRYVANVAAPDAADVFLGAGTPSAGVFLSNGANSSGDVVLSGVTIGVYTEAGGVLAIRFAPSGVSATMVNAVLNGLIYRFGIAGAPLVPGVVIGAQIDDANNDPVALNGHALDPSGPHDQGPGGNLLSNVLTATIDVSHAAPTSVFTEPNDFGAMAAAVPVVPTIDLSDIAATNGQPSRVVLTITNGHPEDVLSFTNTVDISGTYSHGTMTLTPVSGHAPTLAEWQDAVRSVRYYDTSNLPNTDTRLVNVTVLSGDNVAIQPGAIAIVAVNDSPILDTAVVVSLDHHVEYQGTNALLPQGAVGTPVGQLIGRIGTVVGNVTDPDGSRLTGDGPLTAPGIAIIGCNNADAGGRPIGTWYYSIDNGVTWTAFPDGISETRPLDLSSTARIAFQPSAADFNGQIPNAITFRAWDGFDGVASGSQADLTGATAFGQSAADNTAATAYSIAATTLPLMIDNVNNAPEVVGFPVAVTGLPPISTSGPHNPGQTVAELVGGAFTDPQDSQFNPEGNAQGSGPNDLAGIAITGNAATPGQGVWEYSLDGGVTWTPIPTDVSPNHAIILPAGARLAFEPVDGFVGHPGPLLVNLIDSSPSIIAPGLTGAQLAREGSDGTPLTAETNADILVVGGSSGFAAATISLDILVAPVPRVPALTRVPDVPGMRARWSFPDGLWLEPSGLQFWTTDDYLGRALVPGMSLVGSIANRFIIAEQHAIITVPSNMFVDSLP